MPGDTLFDDAPDPAFAPRDAVFVRVAVERGVDARGGTGADGFSYWCAAGDVPGLGERVEVPLGRSRKSTAGVVIAVDGVEPPEGLKRSVVRPLTRRTGASLSPTLVELGKWIARYYACPLGMALTAMMPAAVKKRTGERAVEWIALTGCAMELIETNGVPPLTLKPAARRLWATIAESKDRDWPAPLRTLIESGLARSPAPFRELATHGLLMLETRRELVSVEPVAPTLLSDNTSHELSNAQAAAILGIGSTLGTFCVHLLRGVTGSGKTEVYIRLIQQAAARGQSSIVLVPEIILTPQTHARFASRLGADRVVVMHSGLSATQRNQAWRTAADTRSVVVLGPRSAVFAPVESLGLVIVDEEHDSSYKQESVPRINARDVAIKRAQLQDVPVVLGSATPSLESWHHAIRNPPRYRLWELPERVGGASLPAVTVVDLKAEGALRRSLRGDDGRIHLLGPTLEAALEDTLNSDGQCVLLLNRRGFAQYIACPSARCGFVLGCDQCDSNLVLHRGKRLPVGALVRCHHCLSEQLVPRLCPACGQKLNAFGGGTQRAQEELIRKFTAMGLVDGTTLLRVDADEMRTPGDYFRTLESFASGEARVLIGTQMLSKGLDFPGVRLVGVIDADTALSIPDFRAAERTFQLVSQVAGRAGRGGRPGKVIVQTHRPLDPAILFAARHDFSGFAAHELACRHAAGLPPFARMVRLIARDRSETAATGRATDVAALLRSDQDAPLLRISGPAPCSISRIAGQFRVEVVVVAPDASTLQRVLRHLRSSHGLKSDASLAIDVDPVSMM